MTENPYPLGDRRDARLLGRCQALKLVLERLNKLHVCVTAPQRFGKTVFLREVARVATANGFSQVLAWDLKRHTPGTDEEFYQSLCREMERQLQVPGQDLAEWFREMGPSFETIKGVFQELCEAGQKILVVLDAVEHVLQAGLVTKNVWDNLRDLADLSGVRFLTGSRFPLRQLCPLYSKTSPFGNIFHPKPVRFGAFQSDDWPGVLQPFAERHITLDASARKELVNWTGGIPVLVMAVCEGLFESCQDGQTLSKPEVDQAAEGVVKDYREHIDILWADLAESRLDFWELATQSEKSRSSLIPDRIDELVHRGLAVEVGGNKLRGNCRIMERYAAQHGKVLPEVQKLFGAIEDYDRNIGDVFQLRLNALRGFNNDAEHHLRELLKAMPNSETAKALIRNFADSCLDALVQFEFPDETIDQQWIGAWKSDGKLGNSDNDREIISGRVPQARGTRMKLLGLLHDEKSAGKAKSRRSTFLLLEAVHKAGNFGQHAKEYGELVTHSFITAVCCAAVELFNHVREDTRQGEQSKH
ncbi:MAG TPA: AAA-like domain-containing protein [Candidatus Paceibacterota bacterium]|nr:AAA-like domain-containing protein [Verrucomicrobiota bacterium]HRY47175.1 AAA-like domain-containing protein [Candidatus Paceibacterota bacterium]